MVNLFASAKHKPNVNKTKQFLIKNSVCIVIIQCSLEIINSIELKPRLKTPNKQKDLFLLF